MEWLESLNSVITSPIPIGDAFLPFTPLEGLVGLVLPVIVLFLGGSIGRRVLRRRLERSAWTEEARAQLLRWTRRVYRAGSLVVIVASIGRLFGAQIFAYIGAAFSALREPIYASGGTEISAVTLLLLIPVFYAATWLSRVARRVTSRTLSERVALDAARRFSISSLISYAVMALVVLVGFSIVGIDLSSLTVIFGVLGIGLGFGLQSSVANFFAGIVIIFSRPVKEGDFILLNDYEGTVEHIRLVSTVITTVTNETIIVPNSQIVDNYVHNYSFEDISIYLCTEVQVSYSSDLDTVDEVLHGVARNNPYAKPHDEGRVLFRSFDDSGITVRLCSNIRDARDKNLAGSWMVVEIRRAFREAGIEIPFPQRDVHVKSMPRTAALEPESQDGADEAL